MPATPNFNPPALSGQPLTQDTIQKWSHSASRALAAVIGFRSALHRWQAAGCVDAIEYANELAALDDAGLAGFVDELIGKAMEAITDES